MSSFIKFSTNYSCVTFKSTKLKRAANIRTELSTAEENGMEILFAQGVRIFHVQVY